LSFAAMMKSFSPIPLIFLVCIEIVEIIPSTERDLGMMPLGLGKGGSALDARELPAKIPKTVGQLDPLRSIQQLPVCCCTR
jgi:hypothetical protein